MSAFTPISAALGGALIGLSAVLLMLFNGRQAGISGIFGDLFLFRRSEFGWEIAFLAGLIVAPWLMTLAGFSLPHPQMPVNWAITVIGGLLVGFGTRWSGGCTSGHGVCGIARFSTRSISATCVFMAAAIVTVAVTRHVIGV